MAHQLLKGKRGIIFGALDPNSIAWKVAKRAHEEGAVFTLTNAPVAMRMGAINELAAQTGAQVIPADATLNEDLENLFSKSMEILGGKIDFVLHSIGMSPNVRKNIPYTQTNYDFFHKTLDISALSLHRTLQTAMKMDAISEWGSVVALSYIAAQRVFPDYNDMADAKSLLESIARSFGYQYGKARKVRVNTISQSPTKTTAWSDPAVPARLAAGRRRHTDHNRRRRVRRHPKGRSRSPPRSSPSVAPTACRCAASRRGARSCAAERADKKPVA